MLVLDVVHIAGLLLLFGLGGPVDELLFSAENDKIIHHLLNCSGYYFSTITRIT